ncbi:MAG: cysteine-rich CWC family protein [Burkholderiales bacterium]|nr:cysteine-rich CWC family protein [Burkholderiales bacterium]
MTQPVPLPNHLCPLCGGPNGCAPAACGSFDTPCWCRDVKFDADALGRIPESQRNKACLCRNCAAGDSAQRATCESNPSANG